MSAVLDTMPVEEIADLLERAPDVLPEEWEPFFLRMYRARRFGGFEVVVVVAEARLRGMEHLPREKGEVVRGTARFEGPLRAGSGFVIVKEGVEVWRRLPHKTPRLRRRDELHCTVTLRGG